MIKRTWNRLAVILSGLVLSVSMASEVKAEDRYTYNYDFWQVAQESPDVYEVAGVFTSKDMGLDVMLKSPQGLFVQENFIYICDTGNNRILELKRIGRDQLELVRIIEQFHADGVENTFSGPADIAVSEEGNLYIADRNRGRIVMLSPDLDYIRSYTKPEDATFDQSLDFLPDKISIDTAGRVYCVATNVNKGLIKYEKEGKFSGFIGATKVRYNFIDYVWKRIATKRQRAAMESFVPTEYDNVYMDQEGFLYVSTCNTSPAGLMDGSEHPVRKLNMMGDDIMIRNGNNIPVIGDLDFGSGGGMGGPSRLCDVTVMDNDVFTVLDETRGRLFSYDDQGRLLYAFGGIGNMDGYFKTPVAMDHQGHDLLVLDSQDNSVTIFTPTAYGQDIFLAIEQFQAGEYEASGASWKRVMNVNGNYELAYIGIGRSLLRQKKYKESLEYFKCKWDEDNYSKAFKEYRKEWVEDHIVWIAAGILALFIVPLILHHIGEIRNEINTSELFQTDEENGGSHD